MKKYSKHSLNILKKQFKKEWLFIFLLSLGNIALAALTVEFAVISKNLVDSAVAAEKDDVIRFAVVLALISAANLALQALMSGISETSRARMKNSVRQQLLISILHKEFASSSKYHSGELVNRMFSDVRVISEGIVGIVPPLLGMIVKLCSATVVLWQFSPEFTPILLAFGILMTFGGTLCKKKMKSLHKNVQSQEDSVNAVFVEISENLRFIKASGAEKKAEVRAENSHRSFFAAQMKRRNFSVFTHIGFGAVTEICFLLTLVWGCLGISEGVISFGTLTAMMQLVGQIQSPLAAVPTLLQRFYGVSASADRLRELLSLPDETVDCELNEKHFALTAFDSVALNNLQFDYNRNEVLTSLNGEIKNGDFVAITGLSGTGKTTLFLLLLGIYKSTGGSIEISFGKESLPPCCATRALFSYVPQGNAVFSGSIRDNLTFLCENADDDILWNAAKIACIDDFIESLPDKMDTILGERGLGLSEGQAQRIAVARAIVSNTPILLLDEATSALDEETEASLLSNLSRLNGKTCLIVTHRRAALSICNKQLCLENGAGVISQINNTMIDKNNTMIDKGDSI